MKLQVVNLGRTDYRKALEVQEKLLALRQAGKAEDTLILLEHPPVITIGRRGTSSNILAPLEMLRHNGVEIHEVNRGGDVTYHGPGQLVGYPIIDLNHYGRDIKNFVAKIESVFIRLLEKEFDIKAHSDEKKYTGVWVGDNKITAIGMAVKRWVTMHGFAFNVNTDLEHFSWINPCGITDKGVTSLEKILGHTLDFDKVRDMVIRYFGEVFGVQLEVKASEEFYNLLEGE